MKRHGEKYRHANVLCVHNKLELFLSDYVDDLKWLERSRTWDRCGNFCKKTPNVEVSTPFKRSSVHKCSQREALVDPQAVQSETELFKKLTTREADEKLTRKKHIRWKRSLVGAKMCRTKVKKYCARGETHVASLQHVATLWSDHL